MTSGGIERSASGDAGVRASASLTDRSLLCSTPGCKGDRSEPWSAAAWAGAASGRANAPVNSDAGCGRADAGSTGCLRNSGSPSLPTYSMASDADDGELAVSSCARSGHVSGANHTQNATGASGALRPTSRSLPSRGDGVGLSYTYPSRNPCSPSSEDVGVVSISSSATICASRVRKPAPAAPAPRAANLLRHSHRRRHHATLHALPEHLQVDRLARADTPHG